MESTPEQAAEGLAIVRVLSAVLDRLVSANVAASRTDPGQVTKFHAMKAPGIGIQQYLERYVLYLLLAFVCVALIGLLPWFILLTLAIAFLVESTSTRHVPTSASFSRSFTLTDSSNGTTFC